LFSDIPLHVTHTNLSPAYSNMALTLAFVKVTDMDFCTSLYNLHAAGKNVTLVVSYRIYGAADCALALTCYNYLYNKVPSFCICTRFRF
jgi:hypothetical protein